MLRGLRYQRMLAGLTQEELADKAGISRQTVILLEAGRQEPRPSSIKKLARALHVKPAELMDAAE